MLKRILKKIAGIFKCNNQKCASKCDGKQNGIANDIGNKMEDLEKRLEIIEIEKVELFNDFQMIKDRIDAIEHKINHKE